MAYFKNGWLVVKSDAGDELVIDEFDEDAVDIEAEADKVNIRYTTKGKGVFSMLKNVPYRLTIAIPPHTNTMKRVIDFLNVLKNKDYPDLSFSTYEKIDTKTKITSYEDGNIAQDLFYESIMKDDAPTGTFQIVGTRTGEEFQ
jgi:hypothetical protein